MKPTPLLVLALSLAACSGSSVVGGPVDASVVADAVDDLFAVDTPDVPAGIDAPDAPDVPDAPDAFDAPFDVPDPDALVTGSCRGDGDCPASAPVCDATTRRCVACTSARNTCGAGQYCDGAAQRCLSGCSDDPSCGTATSSADGGMIGDGGAGRQLRCDLATRACVECVTNDHCPAGTLCVGNLCVTGCTASQPCPTGQSCCSGACVDPQANVAHCGACGTRCSLPNAVPGCLNGTCAVAMCSAPFADCDGSAATGCETDTNVSLAHCGGCNRACEARPHATTTCEAGRCAYACEEGFADCDGVTANGCEVDTRTSTDHCGACAVRCDLANATAACAAGRCAVAACSPDFGDCDGNVANGCEADLRTSVSHCNGCTRACLGGANTLVACAARACVRVCTTGFADCDNDELNGCEADTRVSNDHCGGCGRACRPTGGAGACTAGSCTVTACTAPFADCDALAANGCEVDVSRNVDHCGGCGARCAARVNATAGCAATACTYSCGEGFGDCDGVAANGCETDTRASVSHCGGCGQACAVRPNTVTTCAAGACAYACATGFADCDANTANGCEVDTRTSAGHCGACSRACSVANGAAACVAGACVVASCAAGFADCDASAANGCEVTLAQSGTHCGRCNNACAAGLSCYAGLCSTTCGDPTVITSPVAGCTNIAPLGVASAQSTWTAANLPQYAADGNRCTGWNAGTYASRFWQVDLREAVPVRGITLVPGMSPTTASVVHVVAVSIDGATFTTVRTISQVMTNGVTYPFDFGSDVVARYVRVTTTTSPSWVSWLDVGVFRCF